MSAHALACSFSRSEFGLVGASVRRCARRTFRAQEGCLLVHFRVPSSALLEQACAGARGAPSVPWAAGAGRFRVLSSAWSEQACAGARGAPSVPLGGECRPFSRSEFGFVGASVRRCAWRTFRAVGGGCRSFSRSEFGFVGVAAGYLIFLRYKICFAVGRKRLRLRVLGRWNPKKFTILF